MKTIHRSIFMELLPAFLLGLLAFNFVFMTESVLSLAKMLAPVGASLADMAMMVVYLQPKLTVMTTPMAFFLAVLVTYGRLNAENEITIMRSCGMSFREISRPVFFLGAGCFLMGLMASFQLAPMGSRNLREAFSEVIARRAPYALEEGIFNTSFRDVVIYVKKKTGPGRLRDVFLYDTRKKARPSVMFAEEGIISSAGGGNVSIELRDGHIYIVRGSSATDLSFGRYIMPAPFAGRRPDTRYDELSPMGLLRKARTAEGRERTKSLLEFHRRLSMPGLCLLLMFLGPPLALRAGKTGKLGGMALGLLVFAGYYSISVYTENLAISGRLPHYAGAWTPALVVGTAALWLFRREETG